MIKKFNYCFWSIIILFCINEASAHEIRPAYLQINQLTETSYQLLWKLPRVGEKVIKLEPVFPSSFKLELIGLPKYISGSMLFTYQLEGSEALAGQRIKIQNLDKTLIDVLVNVEYLNGEKATVIIQPDKNFSILPGVTNGWSVIKSYTILGAKHIWMGIDHLLFVLALILLTTGFSKIVKTITAFTLAHSITLSLAALGVVKFPGPPVEAVIALSIVFLASEILKNNRGEQTLTGRKPWLVAFIFGLLHGFGFAGALTEIGLPQTEIPLALGFFNVGVELGQLAFVIIAIGIIWLLGKTKIKWPDWAQKIPPYAIGTMASFWMIERFCAFF